jgi:hypothetical protein
MSIPATSTSYPYEIQVYGPQGGYTEWAPTFDAALAAARAAYQAVEAETVCVTLDGDVVADNSQGGVEPIYGPEWDE